ncbi:MAG: hypothetical protein U0R78_11580 [Nocardioidaceae bacterium]
MVISPPKIDMSHSDIARFYPHQRTRAHVRARTSEAFNKTYGIVHPGEQWSSDRPQRVAPMYDSEKEMGPSSSRPPAGNARSGMSPTPGSWRSTATR